MKKKLLSCIGIMMSLTMVCSMGGFASNTSVEKKNAVPMVAAKKASKKSKMTTLKILGTNHTFAGANGRTVTLQDWATKGKSKRWKELTGELKKRGIKLDLNLIEQDQYETTCQTMAASGEFAKYDLVNISTLDSKTQINLAKQGQIQSISDIWEKYSDGTSKKLFSTGVGKENVRRMMLDDKKCYWLNSIRTVSDAGGMERNMVLGFAIRQDWLDALGKKLPTTMDELTSDLEAFRANDMNKNGKKDEFVCIPYDSFATDIAQWFGLGSDITFINTQDNNKVTSPWYQKHIKDYIAYMNQLYSKGLLKLSDKNAQTYQTNDQVAGIADWGLELWLEPTITVPKGGEYPWFAPIRIQAVKDQKPLFRIANQDVPATTLAFAVPAKSKKQKAIAKLLDYLATDEAVQLTEAGIEGVSYKMVDGVPKNIMDGSLKNTDALGAALWNNAIFPRFELQKDGRIEMQSTVEFAKDHGVKNNATAKYDYTEACNKDMADMTYTGGFAVPTLKEVAKINDITTDLTTYSSELLTKLITGEKSLKNWDSYIKDLKKLGLDDLIKTNQAMYDRVK